MIGVEREERAAEIGDVLAHGEIALEMDARKRLIAIELTPEDGGARRELLGVSLGPPGGEHAGAIVLSALVVKAVDHFMADHRADAAIVDSRIGRGIEEG